MELPANINSYNFINLCHLSCPIPLGGNSTMLYFMMAQVDEIIAVLIFAGSSIRKVYDFVKFSKFAFQKRFKFFNEQIHCYAVLFLIIGNYYVAQMFYFWTTENMPIWVRDDYALREALLKNRYSAAKTVIGTQSYHGFIGIDETHIEMKVFLTVLPQKYVKFRLFFVF
jgi:hypothetical protein